MASAAPPPVPTTFSTTHEVVVQIAFGLVAVAASGITLWQGHRLWRTLRRNSLAEAHELGTPINAEQRKLVSEKS